MADKRKPISHCRVILYMDMCSAKVVNKKVGYES